MQETLFEILNNTPEYREYLKSRKIYPFVLDALAITFWSLAFLTGASSDAPIIILFIGMTLLTISDVMLTLFAFIEKPNVIMRGKIVNIETKGRRTTHVYTIQGDTGSYQAECLYHYNHTSEREHHLNDEVLFFSTPREGNYIIDYPEEMAE